MITPISNDKILSSGNSKSGSADTKSAGSASKSNVETNATAANVTKPADDTVNVGRASQLYRSAASEPTGSASNINTAEEAAQLAARITEQLSANGAQAMQAQTSSLGSQVGTLLSAAP